MRRLIPAALALALASCGDPAEENGENSDGGNAAAVEGDLASADNADRPSCWSMPNADDRMDNDVLGIDLGMSADDAVKIAKCNEDGFTVEVSGTQVALPDGTRPRGLIHMTKEGDEINIYVLGMPGQEKVFGIARVAEFAEGSEPTIERMRATLTEKYGPLITASSFDVGNPNKLARAFTPDGRALPGNNEIGGVRCAAYFGQNDNLAQLDERCGFTKKIEVRPKYGNPALAGGYSVWIADQRAVLAESQRVLSEIAKLEQGQLEAERRDAESADRVPDL